MHTSIVIIDVFKGNMTQTVWHLSCPLLNRQVKQERRGLAGEDQCSPVQEDTELQCWLGSGDLGSVSGTVTFWWVSPTACGGHGQLSVFPENSNRKWSAALLGAAQITSSVLPRWVRVVEAKG